MGQMMTSPNVSGQNQQLLSGDHHNNLNLAAHQRLVGGGGGIGGGLSLSSGGGGGGGGGGNSSGVPMHAMRMSKKRLDDKKTCRWVLDNGTICGKTFSKFDSLRRHVQELHKGIRPYICSLCEKSYGRRDYLDRHLKTHTADASNNGLGVSGDSLIVGDNGSVSDVDDHDDDDDDMDDDDDDDDNHNLTNVVTVITTDE